MVDIAIFVSRQYGDFDDQKNIIVMKIMIQNIIKIVHIGTFMSRQ